MHKFYLIVMIFVGMCFHQNTYGENEVDSLPVPVVRISPRIPDGMTNKTMPQGYVTVQFEVSKNGTVESPVIIESNPERIYDKVALEAVLKFKFKPALKAGQPVRFTATQRFDFDAPNSRSYNQDLNLSEYDSRQLSFTLERSKKSEIFHSTLIVKDKVKDEILKKITMPVSQNDWPMLASDADKPYVFFYHSISKSKSKLKIYQRSDLSLIHDLDIEPLSQTKQGGSGYKVLFSLFDTNKLIFATSKKKPKLQIVDALSGRITEKKKFEKNTLFSLTDDEKYLWAMKVSNLSAKTIRTNLLVLSTESFEAVKEVPIHQKVESIYYLNGVLEMTFQYKSLRNFRVLYLRLTDGEYIGDYNSDIKPKFFHDVGSSKVRFIVGMSEDGTHLNIAKFVNGVFSQITEDEIEIQYNQVQIRRKEDESSLLFFAEEKFLKFNLFDPASSVLVNLPINAAVGFFNRNYDKVYLSEYQGSQLVLVDLKKGEIVASEKSKFGGLKFALTPQQVRTLSIPVPSDYTNVSIKNGFYSTENIVILDDEEERVFALRVSSSYLTSFNAADLTDKRTVNTGRQSFQLVQKVGDPDSPIIVIGIRQITFVNPKNGRLISYFKYDSPIAITNYDELTYVKDGVISNTSIEELMRLGVVE